MNLIKIIVIIVLVLSLAANVVLGMQLYSAGKKNQDLGSAIRLNDTVANFADLFIAKVLRANGEISFEDRLKIENAVRDTEDKDIYDQWQKFVGAGTEAEGREEIKNLLQLIVDKLSR
ncbi:MAG: hypothetical protein A3D44_02005 [Candidatus Staskawiczbacteria bacterium RIFCSPHIGHO2_02_FULL_42_22]|uniref:Chemotaxis methyl-accepting receptor HlyB-like 4HB MCP domain-containing protein n=1 Tax=Candidatus Staskawiczbacteria bacterium RIFCSPHIGHO2_02_FULL_42_22 TaxID=1802207 RepID=A0A1G2I3W6_9BACT|nr:MAG: hypothetical protein A3D44_02005 [Candidatus Staskawiczbacteria bacterium RIFCSPHIGHO2_02_FULL_42_22]